MQGQALAKEDPEEPRSEPIYIISRGPLGSSAQASY